MAIARAELAGQRGGRVHPIARGITRAAMRLAARRRKPSVCAKWKRSPVRLADAARGMALVPPGDFSDGSNARSEYFHDQSVPFMF
jgi:hypothetical protein